VSNSPSNKEQSQLFVQTPTQLNPGAAIPKTSKSRPAMADNTETPRPNTLHSSRKPTARPSQVCENRILFATKCRATQPHIDMNKTQRAKLHRSINGLSPQDLAGIVEQSFLRAKGGKIDQLARVVIARAHRQVWPASSAQTSRHG
jgi:hypothetical protein